MKRRKFGKLSLMASAAMATYQATPARKLSSSIHFPLHFAPHPGMFRHHAGEDIVAQLEFMAEVGFTAFEDNDMRLRSPEQQERIVQAMDRLGLHMGVFVAHTISWNESGLTSGDQAVREEFLAEIRGSVEVAKRVRAKWMTVVPGHLNVGLEMEVQSAHVVEACKLAAAILEPHRLVMVLEPLNSRDHPGMFLTRSAQAYAICRTVDSPACKILYDVYHQQISEGNLIPNIEAYWNEIGYFQVGDNPGRKEPGTGEINYLNIFRYLASQSYHGIVGMEHGNSLPGKEGERLIISAYEACSAF